MITICQYATFRFYSDAVFPPCTRRAAVVVIIALFGICNSTWRKIGLGANVEINRQRALFSFSYIILSSKSKRKQKKVKTLLLFFCCCCWCTEGWLSISRMEKWTTIKALHIIKQTYEFGGSMSHTATHTQTALFVCPHCTIFLCFNWVSRTSPSAFPFCVAVFG